MTNPSEDVEDIYEDYNYDPEDDYQTDTEAVEALYGVERDYRDYLNDCDWHSST